MIGLIWVMCVVTAYTVATVSAGYLWGRAHQINHDRHVQDMMNDAADNARMAQRHRIRTAEADLNSNAQVRTARLRAYRYKTPPPRK